MKNINLKNQSYVGAKFKVEKLKENKILEEYNFNNLVLDSGLDGMYDYSLIYGTNNLTQFCNVGSGTTVPQTTDTELENYLGNVNFGTSIGTYTYQYVNDLPIYTQVVKTYVFTEGQVVGNVSEIGLSSSIGGIYFNRALILDDEGTPTSISLAEDEQLRVTAYIRCYHNLLKNESEDPVSFLFDEVEYSFTRSEYSISGWAYSLNQYSIPYNAIKLWNAAILNTITTSSITIEPYVPGSFSSTKTFVWSAVSGSGTIEHVDIRSVVHINSTFSRLTISPSISKSTSEEITFKITRNWGRYVE